MIRRATLAVAFLLGVPLVHAADVPAAPTLSDQDVTREVEQWRQDRLQRLTAPDGWLSLIGLEWLHEGANRIGHAADNDVVLAAGPDHLGSVTLDKGGALTFAPVAGSGATVGGKTVTSVPLVDDMHAGAGSPTTVQFGTASFYVIDRDGRKALRVKDPEAPTRKHFLGIESFPIDPAWRIVAKWVPFDPPHKLQIGSVIGTIDAVDVPGKAVFERDGKTFELLPYQEEPGGELFFVIADRTSGKQTYGAARFLYAALPAGGVKRPGSVVLDFNRAYNPPCAFTPFATCPLAPPENRLDIAVTAGEKKYAGSHH